MSNNTDCLPQEARRWDREGRRSLPRDARERACTSARMHARTTGTAAAGAMRFGQVRTAVGMCAAFVSRRLLLPRRAWAACCQTVVCVKRARPVPSASASASASASHLSAPHGTARQGCQPPVGGVVHVMRGVGGGSGISKKQKPPLTRTPNHPPLYPAATQPTLFLGEPAPPVCFGPLAGSPVVSPCQG
jgi:hypothetical protein